MKNLMLMLGLIVSTQASGISRDIFTCNSGAIGEAIGSVTLIMNSTSAPGGPVQISYIAAASAAWLNGTHSSGAVKVNLIQAEDGGPLNLVNEEAGFSVTLRPVTTDDAGNILTAEISGSFKDLRTGVTGQLAGLVYRCN